MMIRLALVAASVLALAGCSQGLAGMPIYVGDEQVGRLPGGPPQAGTVAAATPATECQRLVQRVQDTGLTDAQRLAAADYSASIGC